MKRRAPNYFQLERGTNMTTQFNPSNPIIKRCIEGMILEENNHIEEAMVVFIKAWGEANDDYERFIAAYHLGLRQARLVDKLKWMENSLSFALKIKDGNVQSAYPILYATIAQYYEAMGDPINARKNHEWSIYYQDRPNDAGPFYHGTKADLQVGDLLTAGGKSNYEDGLKMKHIYFTANSKGAGLAAVLAKGAGRERVYIVEPTGEYEDDPNVTDKKFPGNLTRSYRSQAPLRIVTEETEWDKLTSTDRQEWDEKLSKNKGDIIN